MTVSEPKPGWRERFAARTPEEADRRRFGLWVLIALILLLPPWWMWGADLAAAGLRPLAGLTLWLFGMTGEISVGAEGGWGVATGLELADGSGNTLRYPVSQEVLRRLLLGAPLFAAFMIAPPRSERRWRAALIGLIVLAVLFVLSLTAFVWGEIAPMLNPDLAPAGSSPGPLLAAPPLHPLAAQVALIARYLAISVAPLIVSVVLWAVLNPRGREALLGALDETR